MKKIFSLFAVAAFAVSVVAQPSALPTAPTHPANQVKAVYSTTYNADCGYGEWGSGTQYSQDTYGKKYVTTNLGYFGLVDFELNCSKMEVLHLDVWSAASFSMGIVPIHGAAEVRVTKDVVGGQWNAIEIPLSAFEGVTNWTNVYQIKIDNVGNQTFWLNNVYFYTTQVPEEDTEAPTALTASLAYASYFSDLLQLSKKLALKEEDGSMKNSEHDALCNFFLQSYKQMLNLKNFHVTKHLIKSYASLTLFCGYQRSYNELLEYISQFQQLDSMLILHFIAQIP